MAEDVLKIVPSPDELQITNRHSQCSLKCTEMGCSYVATNSSVLGLHKAKVHNIRATPEKGSEVHYHCPVAGCYFNPQSERYFKNLDVLRTHYMKVHSEKKFSCVKCGKGFGLERDCHRHEKECGEQYACPQCGKTYTNSAALQRHCDYKRHKKPEKTVKPKQIKEKTPPKPKVKSKKKVTVTKKTCQFILPKQPLPALLTPSQQHSLEIQTDASGAQFFITKMTSDSSVSQAVQTVERLNMRRSAGIQTTFHYQPRQNGASGITERLSTGIQTVMPNISVYGERCAAQTQTKDSILQQAMAAACLPTAKVCKATQKSPSSVGKRKRKSKASSTAGSQTCSTMTSGKKFRSLCPDPGVVGIPHSRSCHDKEVQMEFHAGLVDFVSTMSTQTNLSCVSEQHLSQLHSADSKTQLQDCHTQTQGNDAARDIALSADFIQNHGGYFRTSTAITDQVTQTKLYDINSDQNTQTGDMIASSGSNSFSFGFLSIQDNQTQTSSSTLNSGVIHNSHTQTQLSFLTDTAAVQDQGTSCDGLFSLTLPELVISKATPSSCFSTHIESTKPAILGQESVCSSQPSCEEQLNFDSDSGIDFLLDENTDPQTGLKTSESTEALAELLMEAIDESQNSLKDDSSEALPVASMETQTFGNMGMDCTTQTMDDLGWDMSTQTVDDLFNDMMTQTGDDLLEFLTNDIQTQTLVNDFCEQLTSPDKFSEYLNTSSIGVPTTSDNAVQINLDNLFEDHASTQTVWDAENDTLDLHSSSFAAPSHILSRKGEQNIQKLPGSFLEREDKFHENFDLFSQYPSSNVVDSQIPTSETIGVQSSPADLARPTETSQTQTIYDPIFADLEDGDTSCQLSARPTRYLESSQTQTNFDPMLSAVVNDDDPLSFPPHGVFMQKESSETQTGRDDYMSAPTETAQCQTQWDDSFTSVDTSETQTYNTDFFGISCADTQTQTGLGLDVVTALELTDSFTQTNVDQNTQTGCLFDF